MNLMIKLSVVLPVFLLLASCAEIKDTGRAIGHGTRDVAKKVGHTTRDVTKKIGHASRDAAKAVSQETKEVVEDLKGEDKGKSCQSDENKECKKIEP